MKSYQQRTYYELLDLPVNASADEIRIAYQRTCELSDAACLGRYELVAPNEVANVRERLREAVGFLTDPDLRAEYDRSLGPTRHEKPAPNRTTNPTQLSLVELLSPAAGWRSAPAHPSVSYFPRPTRPDSSVADGAFSYRTEPSEAAPRQPRTELKHAPLLAEQSAIASAEAALAQVSARAQRLRKPVKVPADADFNGELLRQVRESRGLALQQVSERTRVPLKHLENIEADRYRALPATVYLRGILVNLARELKLDPVRVVRSYIAVAGVGREGGERS